ncbi:DgyrCDS5975 [Dimorphilus gyrociliatus]|uniref:DgyrCDS5975 n=1 Tax=Dimorphilus gyrociliatus TaxID=2664684 RepID=A0A7I8VLQ4_9ANNE|nr:DgyrCDS5975 [Dimorphilus gyrociliatus]
MAADNMECVRNFNTQLGSLYEAKPPVSKAKMATVTKAALKANKYYKHVVQSVEKFVLKCGQEYKVPGLYVIDSIIRQSRHQYGEEKDMFVKRFTKNIVTTFENLYKCCESDKEKIGRVLKLWLQNSVFPEGIIKALLELGKDPSNPSVITQVQARIQSISGMAPTAAVQKKAAADRKKNKRKEEDDLLHLVTEMLDQGSAQSKDEQLKQLKNIQDKLIAQNEKMIDSDGNTNNPSKDMLMQIQALMEELKSDGNSLESVVKRPETNTDSDKKITAPDPKSETSQNPAAFSSSVNQSTVLSNQTPFNKELLDFDYGDDSDSDTGSGLKRRSSQSPSFAKRSKVSDNSDRDIERRRRKTYGLPAAREGHLSLCSTTIWLGHLSKGVQDSEIWEEVSKFGIASSINLVPPRGCAYVAMKDRKSAAAVLRDLKGSSLGYNLKLAWTQGKGIKESPIANAIWVEEDGVTYIPWDSVPHDIKTISTGGWIDEDTLPPSKRGPENVEETTPEQNQVPTMVPPPQLLPPGFQQLTALLPGQLARPMLQQPPQIDASQPNGTQPNSTLSMTNVLHDILSGKAAAMAKEKATNAFLDRQKQLANGTNQMNPPMMQLRMPLPNQMTSSSPVQQIPTSMPPMPPLPNLRPGLMPMPPFGGESHPPRHHMLPMMENARPTMLPLPMGVGMNVPPPRLGWPKHWNNEDPPSFEAPSNF